MNEKLYKEAYNRVLDKKYFFWHMITFIVGNFVLFFLSLKSWTPSIFYLLTLVWMRVLALHFQSVFPHFVNEIFYRNEKEEDRAIKREMKRLKKLEKEKEKLKAKAGQPMPSYEASPAYASTADKGYRDSDLV